MPSENEEALIRYTCFFCTLQIKEKGILLKNRRETNQVRILHRQVEPGDAVFA